jgi:hypothetical protein
MRDARSRSRAWLAILAGPLALACGGDTGSDDDSFGFDAMGTGPAATETAGMDDADDDDGDGSTGTGGSGDSGSDDGVDTGDETGDMPPTGDHALGTIVIGETHPVDMPSAAMGILSASFVPDAAAAVQACGMDVGGCTVNVPPTCPAACLVGETCVYDDACSPICQVPCDAVCAADEVCYFPFPGTAACRKIETFDAGRLDFFGTTVPITLYPPYQLPTPPDGPITQPDKDLTVMATGATNAGFAPFTAAVTTSASVFSTIDEILPAEAFGVGDLGIDWVPGADEMTISLTVTSTLGTTGTVTCEADDTLGTFAVPRMALNAAIEGETANTISVSLQRTHVETTMGLATQGALLEAMVQPEGWVDFTFVSIETGTLTNL